MSNWVLYIIIGQFIYAAVVLTDHFIVSKKIVSKPIVYSLYVSLLSVFAVVAIPFGVTLPLLSTILYVSAMSVSFILSIYFLYKSLEDSNPSEVVPVIGGVSAISAFLCAALLLDDELPGHFILGFTVLTAGMLLISHFKFSLRSFLLLSGSGIFFGLSAALIKLVFVSESFVNGFFWSRMANVVLALMLLLVPKIWKSVKEDWNKPKKPSKGLLVVGNKVMGAIGFLFVLVAIKGGNVAIVNALTALQYVFLLIFAIFFHRAMPEYFEEKVHKHEFLHKSLATGLIVIGFFILFI